MFVFKYIYIHIYNFSVYKSLGIGIFCFDHVAQKFFYKIVTVFTAWRLKSNNYFIYSFEVFLSLIKPSYIQVKTLWRKNRQILCDSVIYGLHVKLCSSGFWFDCFWHIPFIKLFHDKEKIKMIFLKACVNMLFSLNNNLHTTG